MTDQTDSPNIAQALIDTGTISAELRQQAIDAVISGRAQGVQGTFEKELTGRRHNEIAAVSASADDVGTLTEEQLFELAQQTAAQDDGSMNYDAAHRAAVQRFDSIQQQLEAHKFDPTTGAKVYEASGDRRKPLELQARQAWQEVVLSSFTAQAVAKARAARVTQREAVDAEEAALLAIAGTDPKRRAVLEEAILRAEMDDVARKIVALRKAR